MIKSIFRQMSSEEMNIEGIEDIKMIPETLEPDLKNFQMQFGATYWFI